MKKEKREVIIKYTYNGIRGSIRCLNSHAVMIASHLFKDGARNIHQL